MLFYLDHFVETWLLPPGNVLLLAVIGSILMRFWPYFGKVLIIISFITLWLLSTPMIAQRLLDGLQYKYPVLLPNKLTADKTTAIVILEAGLNMDTPEYNNQPTAADSTLIRLRYAAFLHKKTGAPILVSGNDPSHANIDQTDYMATTLKDYFGVPTKWKENRGFNTAQEGTYSVEILKKAGIKKFYLVTHAAHMPRAMYAFQNQGLKVIPAPTGYKTSDSALGKIAVIFPTAESMELSAFALREYIGMLWYHLYYQSK